MRTLLVANILVSLLGGASGWALPETHRLKLQNSANESIAEVEQVTSNEFLVTVRWASDRQVFLPIEGKDEQEKVEVKVATMTRAELFSFLAEAGATGGNERADKLMAEVKERESTIQRYNSILIQLQSKYDREQCRSARAEISYEIDRVSRESDEESTSKRRLESELSEVSLGDRRETEEFLEEVLNCLAAADRTLSVSNSEGAKLQRWMKRAMIALDKKGDCETFRTKRD